MFGPATAGILVKQFLMAAGLKDPDVMTTVDVLTQGGFDPPCVEAYAGDNLPIAPGSKAVVISTSRSDVELTLVLIRRNKC